MLICLLATIILKHISHESFLHAGADARSAAAFTDFLLRVGEGKEPVCPRLGDDMIRLPDEIMSLSTGPDKLITEVFGTHADQMLNLEFLSSRVILGAWDVDADHVNDRATQAFPGEVLCDEVALLPCKS